MSEEGFRTSWEFNHHLAMIFAASRASNPANQEEYMANNETNQAQGEPIPLGQRLYDKPFLLLAAGIIVMLVFYTGWGIWELMTLPPAPLP